MLLLALDLVLRTTTAATAIGIVLAAMRVRSAALRHGAWSAVLVVMLGMPLLTSIVPAVPLPLPSQLVVDAGTIARDDPPAGDSAPASSRSGDAATVIPPLAAWQTPSLRADAARSQTPTAWRATHLLFGIYVVGVLVFATRLVSGYRLVRRLLASAEPATLPDGDDVLQSPAVSAPMTIGILRPRIVLPMDWRTWPSRTLRAVLAHERAHVARRDGFVSGLGQLNRMVFWFHPLAWWLPTTLATHAEHACDDAARDVIGPREYAQVLVEFAAAVALHRQRVAWQTIGVEGSGRLGARIDRLLHQPRPARTSRLQFALTAGASTIVLAGAVACRQPVAPLQPDPDLAKQFAEQAKQTAEFNAAIKLRLDEVDALESRVAANPEDWDARKRLVTYYSAGTSVPWDRKVPGLRRHALWIIEHHPEGEIAPPPLSPAYDPEGFTQAVRLWERHLANADASPYRIYRAAQFFAAYDKTRAEALIMRGLAMDPQSRMLGTHMPARLALYEWHNQLGSLYARGILGSVDYFPTRRFDPEGAASKYAMEVRRKLAGSTDARLLARVGSDIVMARHDGKPVDALRALGREYLQRALAIDPTLGGARTMLARADNAERHERIWRAVTAGGDVADEDRLAYLASKASWAYTQLEGAESWRKDPDLAKRAKPDAKAAAEAVLKLAAERRDSPDYAAAVMTAHHTLGLLALHGGDRDAAVHHMLESVKVPEVASREGTLETSFVAQRLPTYLLKEGERETVIQYYESAARVDPRDRERLMADARAVREGRMPRNYQSVFARTP